MLSVLVFGPEALVGPDVSEAGELAVAHGARRSEMLGRQGACTLVVLLQDEPRDGSPAPAATMEAIYRILMPPVSEA